MLCCVVRLQIHLQTNGILTSGAAPHGFQHYLSLLSVSALDQVAHFSTVIHFTDRASGSIHTS
jgi:hypothetical protein